MKRRIPVLAVVISCLALPAVLVSIGAARHYFATRTTGSLEIAGSKRDYIVHVPKSYDPSKPTALVLSLHGGKNTPAMQMAFSQWNRSADRHGFIVAYPAGEGGALKVWSQRASRDPPRMPDVVFISALIDKLRATYNIDPGRVYANGLSNGGGMSFVLSCTLAHRIAAFGLVGAAHFQPWSWCPDRTPAPMISFHGTADPGTRYHGGVHKIIAPHHRFPDIPQWTAKWAERNRCAAESRETHVAADVARIEWPDCANGASVQLYRIEGGGHTWPGGMELPAWLLGRTASFDANEVMWEFFEAHRRR